MILHNYLHDQDTELFYHPKNLLHAVLLNSNPCLSLNPGNHYLFSVPIVFAFSNVT